MEPCPLGVDCRAGLLALLVAVALAAAPGAGAVEDEAGIPGSAAATRADDELALRRLKTRLWPDLYRRQDVQGLADLLADGFVSIAPDGATTTRAEELAWVRDNAWNPDGFAYTVQSIVWQGDDRVLVLGRGQSTRSDPQGQPCRHRYVSSNLLQRAPGSRLGWQAWSSHVSGVECHPLSSG